MKLIYTEQALSSFEEALEFISPNVSHEKLIEIRDKILDKADTLLLQLLPRSERTIFRKFRIRTQ